MSFYLWTYPGYGGWFNFTLYTDALILTLLLLVSLKRTTFYTVPILYSITFAETGVNFKVRLPKIISIYQNNKEIYMYNLLVQ